MFYDVFKLECKKKGVTENKALIDCKIGRTASSKWKKGAVPRGTTLQKLADYFGVSTDYLLEKETASTPANKDECEITDCQIKAAFFRGANMTEEEMDAAWEDVLDMRELVLKRRAREKGEK